MKPNALANTGRTLFGFFFLAMAGVNTYLLLTDLHSFDSFTDGTFLPFYHELWYALVMPNLLWGVLLLIGFEVGVGLMMLSKGVLVKVGLTAALLFCLALVPANSQTIYNLGLAALLAPLLLGTYRLSLWSYLASLLHTRSLAH